MVNLCMCLEFGVFVYLFNNNKKKKENTRITNVLTCMRSMCNFNPILTLKRYIVCTELKKNYFHFLEIKLYFLMLTFVRI